MKDVVFVVHSFDKVNLGGVLKVVNELSALLSSDFKVRICSIGKIENKAFEVDSRVSIDELNLQYFDTRQLKGIFKTRWFFSTFKALRLYMSGFKSGTCFISTSPPLSILFGFLKISRFKFIACDHTSIIYKLPFGLQYFRLLLLRHMDFYVSLTPKDDRYFKEKGVNSVCIPNFIAKSDLEFSNGNNIVFIGRFSKEKNPLAAVTIFSKSRLYEKGALLKLYGYGDLQCEIIKFIEDEGIGDYVKIINNENDFIKMLANAKCLVMTSEIEGFGLVLLEAMSLGIPCISYDAHYGPQYIIKQGVNGFLVNYGFENDFISKLRDVFNNEVVFEAEKVKESINNFYIESILSKWHSILQ